MRHRILAFRPAAAADSIPRPGVSAAEHLRSAMALLLSAERGRAVLNLEAGQPTVRLGLAFLPDATFRAIGDRLTAALEQVEGRAP